jgi:hypothetical protein
MEKLVISKVYGNHVAQILLTTGLMLVLNEVIKIPFGANIIHAPQPDFLQGSWTFGNIVLVKYRIFLIIIGLVVAVYELARPTSIALNSVPVKLPIPPITTTINPVIWYKSPISGLTPPKAGTINAPPNAANADPITKIRLNTLLMLIPSA